MKPPFQPDQLLAPTSSSYLYSSVVLPDTILQLRTVTDYKLHVNRMHASEALSLSESTARAYVRVGFVFGSTDIRKTLHTHICIVSMPATFQLSKPMVVCSLAYGSAGAYPD